MEKKPRKVIKPVALAMNPVKAAPTGVEKKKDDKPFKTYLVMFTIEKHDSWRIGAYPTKEAFDTYLNHPGQSKHPKVTERRWYIVDRINGTITEEK